MANTLRTQLTASDFNLESLTTKELEQHIDASIALGSNLCIIGRRGGGKTAISRQRTHLANKFLCDMNLSCFERPDMAGFPRLSNLADEFIQYILPMKFKELLTGDRRCVLLLDEVDKAERELFAPLLTIVQERSLNGRLFPNLDCVIMTGNLPSEGGSRPIAPLLDRTEKYLLEATADVWLEWAARPGSNIHPSIIKIIHDHPGLLYDSTDHQHYYGSASPRSWTNGSTMLHFAEANGWDKKLITQKIAGFVGKLAGKEFELYFSTYQSITPIVDAIFNDQPYKDAFLALSPTDRLYAGIIASSRLTSVLDANGDVLKTRESAPIENGRPKFIPVDECIREDNPKNNAVRNALRTVGGFFKLLFDEHPEYVMTCLSNQIGGSRMARWELHTRADWHGTLKHMNAMINPIAEASTMKKAA